MKTIECVVNGVKVEAGQWWMTKGGKILYVVGINPFDDFPIWVHDIEDADVTVTYRHNGVSFEEPEDSLHRHLQFCTGFDWAGDGYRLLNVETDVAALGDEYWNYYYDKWMIRCCPGPLNNNKSNFYRRKIATPEPAQPVTPTVTPSKPAVDPGEGYRLLSDDDVCLEGDEFSFDGGKTWNKSCSHLHKGGGRANVAVYRRKLPVRRPDTEYYLVPGSTRIAYIFRGVPDDAQFQTVLADGSWCVAFSELNPKWQKCTCEEAYENRRNLLYDDDDLEEDDDDFTDLGDVDDEDYDDDDRVQEPQNVTINITVNVFLSADEPDAYAKNVISRYVDKSDSHDVWAKNVIKSWYDKCALDNACCGCGSSNCKPHYTHAITPFTALQSVNAGQLVVVADQPLSTTNPGAGYRLIDKNVDTPKDGDEFLTHDGGWEPRPNMVRPFVKTDTYRRKIEPTEPVCEAGYRWLKADEVIEATDQFKDCFDKQWRNPLFSMGSKAGCVNTWRRPIKPEPLPAPVEYRMLQVGEVIEKGDEYLICGEWDRSTPVGLRVVKHQADQYRRKIDTTKDRYFVFSDGFSCYKVLHPDGRITDVWNHGQRVENAMGKILPYLNKPDGTGFTEVSKDFAEAAIRNR